MVAQPMVAQEPEPIPPLPSPSPVVASSSPTLDLVASPAPSATSDGGWWLGRRWTWVAAGSTVLLGAGAITAGLAMRSKFDSLDKSCGYGSGHLPSCSDSDIAAVHSRQTAANVLWGLTGAAAVTTGVLFYLEGRPIRLAPLAGATTGLIATVRY
jgi:hypothetical protein